MGNQDDSIAKLNKDKKNLEEQNKKTSEDLAAMEDKANHLNKLKQKLEQSLDELEDNFEREKKHRSDVEKAKRKVENDLKMTQETVDDLERVKRELEEGVRRKDVEIGSLNSRLEDEQNLVAQLQRKIKELQVQYISIVYNFLESSHEFMYYSFSVSLVINTRYFHILNINPFLRLALKNWKRNWKLRGRPSPRLTSSVLRPCVNLMTSQSVWMKLEVPPRYR